MIRTTLLVALVSLASLTVTRAVNAQLTLEIQLANLETSIVNKTASSYSVDGYSITSAAGILDKVNWRSIADSAILDPVGLSATLGPGALSFIEVAASNNFQLSELNPIAFGLWQPATRWSLKFPFGTSVSQFLSQPFDATFRYTTTSGTVEDGIVELIAVPEPSATVLVVAMALIGVAAGGRVR